MDFIFLVAPRNTLFQYFHSKNREEREFDSSNLKMNDVFCVSLIRPGKYIVENRIISARMLVEVFPFDKRSVSPKKNRGKG